jgi:D-galactose 1-dehydrogenase
MTAMPFGIAGYGKIARDQHAPAIAASQDFELVAIADPAARHESLPTYADLATMLDDRPDIAAVALCMPPRFRAAAAREAIAAGRHVMLEKPPCATLAEARDLAERARVAGVTLFAAWHSQAAAAVGAARERLAGALVRSVRVAWKEDVRVWHPGQAWIWQTGGFGVFDPGINALSILTAILPGTLHLREAELSVPSNCATPIAARLTVVGEGGFRVEAEFDFRQTGPQSWDIEIETDRESLTLSHGGNRLRIDGEEVEVGPEGEYPALYARFAELIRAGESEVDLAPLELVEGALLGGRKIAVEPFEESA